MRPRLPLVIALVATVAALVAAVPSSAGSGFATGQLPSPRGAANNGNVEPALTVAPDGTLWAASNYLFGDCTAPASACGTDVWRSTDGGKRWTWVANPYAVVDEQKLAVGGYDVDIAVAQEKNSRGTYDLVVASLWELSNGIAVSHDDGRTWELLPVAGMVGDVAGPYPDRPWVGMDGACTAYLAYNEIPGSVTVVHRYDTCGMRVLPGPASLPFIPLESAGDAIGKVSGRFTVDTRRHVLYFPAVGDLGGVASVFVSVSSDGGTTWQLRKVADYSRPGTTPSVWPVTAAVDAAGTLYVAWHDAQHSYASTSRDRGMTWTKPVRLNRPDRSAVYPTVAAGARDQAAVVWYGADASGRSDSQGEMGRAFAEDGVLWRMTVTRTSDGGRRWTAPVAASGPVHRGKLCVSGGGCASDGSRAVYDCFGVSLDLRGRLAAVFTNALPRTSGTTAIVGHSDFLASR